YRWAGRRVAGLLAVAGLIAAGLLVTAPGPRAYAASDAGESDLFFRLFTDHSRVIIESHLPRGSRVPLAAAVSYVDGYTRSRFVYGRCPANPAEVFCVRVYQRPLTNPRWAGLTTWQGTEATITFAPAFYDSAGFSYRCRYIGAVHELGHAMGIWWH